MKNIRWEKYISLNAGETVPPLFVFVNINRCKKPLPLKPLKNARSRNVHFLTNLNNNKNISWIFFLISKTLTPQKSEKRIIDIVNIDEHISKVSQFRHFKHFILIYFVNTKLEPKSPFGKWWRGQIWILLCKSYWLLCSKVFVQFNLFFFFFPWEFFCFFFLLLFPIVVRFLSNYFTRKCFLSL